MLTCLRYCSGENICSSCWPTRNSPTPPRDLTLEKIFLRSPTPVASSFISPRPFWTSPRWVVTWPKDSVRRVWRVEWSFSSTVWRISSSLAVLLVLSFSRRSSTAARSLSWWVLLVPMSSTSLALRDCCRAVWPRVTSCLKSEKLWAMERMRWSTSARSFSAAEALVSPNLASSAARAWPRRERLPRTSLRRAAAVAALSSRKRSRLVARAWPRVAMLAVISARRAA